eukprot:2635077-Amphidinium_carterae.1
MHLPRMEAHLQSAAPLLALSRDLPWENPWHTVLPHCCEHNLAISPKSLRGMQEGEPSLLHYCQHYFGIAPDGLCG